MFELRVIRRVRSLRSPPRFAIAGSCQGCAKCCEDPTIQVGPLVWYMPRLRWLYLFWQRHINGFELKRTVRRGRLFVFECSHFDTETRRCDSYDSRPGMCRDYPRALFDQPWPDLFDGCGYRPVDTQGGPLDEALQAADIPIDARRLLKKKLYLK